MVHFRKRICQCGGSTAGCRLRGCRGGVSPLAPWFPQQAARFCRDTFSKRDVRRAKVSFLIIMCEVLGIRLSWLASLLRMAYRPAYGDS